MNDSVTVAVKVEPPDELLAEQLQVVLQSFFDELFDGKLALSSLATTDMLGRLGPNVVSALGRAVVDVDCPVAIKSATLYRDVMLDTVNIGVFVHRLTENSYAERLNAARVAKFMQALESFENNT